MQCTVCGNAPGLMFGVCNPCQDELDADRKRLVELHAKENPPEKKKRHKQGSFKRGKSHSAKRRRIRAWQKRGMKNQRSGPG